VLGGVVQPPRNRACHGRALIERGVTPMDRRKLIFFVGANPATDAGSVTAAYRFASAAAGAHLDAEVRLAGDAVLAADPAYIATVEDADSLRDRIDQAPAQGVAVSVCPYSTEQRGINDELLADILVEVAEGRSVLVHVG
jgi:sulfur relay (sulfurtransferase) complex TusBCD TusD component (DsrE family)